ncbi:hypothetical protein L2E82_05050 [Cichorium intybus]|uniref:Uncharacterized protein n=1 Tax=Cichorium intybus TaxID=13427 RepID=A0ACB9H6C6_CICIN|nr:hypothetical protein L2E82_05050 [Cichorium intybus]
MSPIFAPETHTVRCVQLSISTILNHTGRLEVAVSGRLCKIGDSSSTTSPHVHSNSLRSSIYNRSAISWYLMILKEFCICGPTLYLSPTLPLQPTPLYSACDDLEKITKVAREMWDDQRVVPADYIEETEELAMKGLMENRHILDLISKESLENSRITEVAIVD